VVDFASASRIISALLSQANLLSRAASAPGREFVTYARSVLSLLLASATLAVPSVAQTSGPVREKTSRTAAQKKIYSHLLYAIHRERADAEAKDIPPGDRLVTYDGKRRALVSIRARVTQDLLDRIATLGGSVVSSSKQYDDIRAYVPLAKLEALAESKDVRAIAPAEGATTNPIKKHVSGAANS